MINRYVKKPVIIEAMYFKPSSVAEELAKLANWCKGKIIMTGEKIRISINTLEGTMYADMGDYIIKGVKDEFYPCKPDIFELSYLQV